MDESGIDNNESFPYGWCEKGKRLHSLRPGKRGERLSIIGALSEHQFFAPMVYQGYCTAKVIEARFVEIFVASRPSWTGNYYG